MRVVEENSRNSLLTLLIKTPLLIGSISSQFSGENSFNGVGKTSSRTTKNSCRKQPPNVPIYRVWKTSRWGLSGLSVDRPVDRPTVIFLTVVPSVDRSVDRTSGTESRLSAGRPSRSTEAFQRAKLSGRSTVPVDRPSSQTCARLCTSRGRPAEARSEI